MPLEPAQEQALEELNERLKVVRDRVRGVAWGHHNGFYLYGRPGTSKTYTVIKTLKELDVPHYHQVGHITPMGLFDLLGEQHDRVIVLDDVSEIFKQPKALQILLAALGDQPDNEKVRLVRYRRQGVIVDVRFTGGIICLSNLELSATPLLMALKSRVHYLKYDPSDEQIRALMYLVASTGWPEELPKVAPEDCKEVTDYLIAESARLAVRLDMRLLVDKALPDFLQWRLGQTEAHWRDLVTATLEEQLVQLKHTPANRLSRQEQKDTEKALARRIFSQHPTREARVAAWEAHAGKSERAFYRRLAEIGLTD